MAKVLKILACVVLLLSIAALYLAHSVYGKREQVLARNQILSAGYISLAPTIEEKPSEYPESKPPVARDTSPVSVDFIEKAVENSTFWTTKYDAKLEVPGKPYDLSNRKDQLATLYKVNNVNNQLEIEKDPLTGLKKMEGPGTMQDLLKDTVAKSAAQYARLTETRQMLTIVRDELIDTITELNKDKVDARKKLKELDVVNAELAKTKQELEDLKPKVAAAQAAQKTAEDKAQDMENQKTIAEDKNKELERDKKDLLKKIKILEDKPAVVSDPTGGPSPAYTFQAGAKGKVVAVNDDWNFVLIELDEAFLKESMGDDLSKLPPTGITMWIKRPGNPEALVTKVRLSQIRAKEKQAIGDILTDWKQMTPVEGDLVIFP